MVLVVVVPAVTVVLMAVVVMGQADEMLSWKG